MRRSFPLPASTALAGKLSAFDSTGCELWNAATNFIREDENQRHLRVPHKDSTRIVVLLRVFAFQLVDTAHHSSSKRAKDPDQCIRNFKIALKACRSCLGNGELELALKVLERCSEYVTTAEEDSPLVPVSDHKEDTDHRAALNGLALEYYFMRMTHAWKSDRIDLAEHFFNKVPATELASSANLSERAADLFCEAGKSFSLKKELELAINWLERALGALDACDLDRLSQDAGDLRLTITTTLG